jgi:hypothetical protein
MVHEPQATSPIVTTGSPRSGICHAGICHLQNVHLPLKNPRQSSRTRDGIILLPVIPGSGCQDIPGTPVRRMAAVPDAHELRPFRVPPKSGTYGLRFPCFPDPEAIIPENEIIIPE